ncbi:MAG: AMP-binding protein, partial [Mycobacterium sp.]
MATAEPVGRSGLSYASGENRPALLETTIGANLAATVSAFPDHDAVVDVPTQRRWTYAQLLADVRRLATGLRRAGVGAGDRVGIWAPNCAEWVL